SSIFVSIFFMLFFFFQAEDGIRDFHVTGVQTCALPISRRAPCPCRRPGGGSTGPFAGSPRRSAARRGPAPPAPARGRGPPAGSRSEERRVGKECRSRWARSRE